MSSVLARRLKTHKTSSALSPRRQISARGTPAGSGEYGRSSRSAAREGMMPLAKSSACLPPMLAACTQVTASESTKISLLERSRKVSRT